MWLTWQGTDCCFGLAKMPIKARKEGRTFPHPRRLSRLNGWDAWEWEARPGKLRDEGRSGYMLRRGFRAEGPDLSSRELAFLLKVPLPAAFGSAHALKVEVAQQVVGLLIDCVVGVATATTVSLTLQYAVSRFKLTTVRKKIHGLPNACGTRPGWLQGQLPNDLSHFNWLLRHPRTSRGQYGGEEDAACTEVYRHPDVRCLCFAPHLGRVA